MHESLYELALHYGRSSSRRFAHIPTAGVRGRDAREFVDFVISLIAASGVIVRKVLPFPRRNKCSRENPRFSERLYFLGIARRRSFRERESRLLVRNEETRFAPATGNFTRRAPSSRARTFELRCSRLIRFDSQFACFYRRPYFTRLSSRPPDYR